ncbi:S phase cyclin A-associated protein in the endoplasmic reticulum isoform X3 [Rana temporaria]|uniref:S phase cyclin A-associated protein in the endoplasmic reticulum isoform X3 n=1 Tax=Rana temporaria TaxID=8407 RepID=UPI001AACEA18|nr:S phase cyclin A-associated protein in the endoplasmic reticulum isoform X3 [Rana temporaria]
MASFQRSNSHDKVRKIVAEEGRTARNLIAWSVPLESKEGEGKSKWPCGKPKRGTHGTHKPSKQNNSLHCKLSAGSTADKIHDKSPTKTRLPRKVDLRARYWAFLFDNLRRAVDEIYVTCESDQSVVECKEVLMMLDNYVRDFKALIDWIQLQEKLEKTDAQSRPTSLAWEVKKMSPGRHVLPSPSSDRVSSTSSARRALNFGGPPISITPGRLTPSGVSWADKVKASHGNSTNNQPTEIVHPCSAVPMQRALHENDRIDGEGWETVQRGRPIRSRSSAMTNKPASNPDARLPQKDDSDKENICFKPPEDTKKETSKPEHPPVLVEPPPKELLCPCEIPLTEITQFTVHKALEEIKTIGSFASQSAPKLPCLDIPVEFLDPLSRMRNSDVTCLAGPSEGGKSGTEMDLSNSMAEVLAKKEELADRLEKANEEAIASAIAEEEQLTREIEAEENDIEIDNESDFSASVGSGMSFCGMSMDWNEVLADYEARESWRQNTSWGDMVEEEPSRPPGHGIHMHEKLSSPSRKRTIAESKKKHEEKQLKAQQLREKLREEKALKLQKLLEREKEVRKWKEELLEQRRKMMDEKLLHAEFQREVQLQAIVKKAQEEEAKVNEIAFINTLEAQNKRHDVLAKLKEYEQRLNELQEERQRRQEEKQARDEAVQERKRVLEAERQARVEELLMKRKEQEARIEMQRQEKERAREDAARERARDREERLAALTAAQQEAVEELQKKIQLKHDESVRRHLEQIEQRKEKAAELSSGRHANTDYAPKLTPYERKKQCTLCSVMISSEVYLFSHIKGKKHQLTVRENSSIQGRELSDEEVEHLSLKKYIVDIIVETAAPVEPVKEVEEKQKNKKKAKKLKTRMNSRAKEYESALEAKTPVSDSPYKAKLQRLTKDLQKQLQTQDTGIWATNKVSALDRALGEVSRILEKQNTPDQISFRAGGGLMVVEQILQIATPVCNPSTSSRIPFKSLCNAVNLYILTCSNCLENCTYVLMSSKITFLLDLLIQQLTLTGKAGGGLRGKHATRDLMGPVVHSGTSIRQKTPRTWTSLFEHCQEWTISKEASPLQLFVPDDDKTSQGRSVNKQTFDSLTTGLLQLFCKIFSCLTASSPAGCGQNEVIKTKLEAKAKMSPTDAFNGRVQDIISYTINIGLIDKLSSCFLSVQGPLDENPKISLFLQAATTLLHELCRLCISVSGNSWDIFESSQDPSGLSAALQNSDLVGVLHMLYCALFHNSSSEPSVSNSKETYEQHTIQVAMHSLRFLNSFATLHLQSFQSVVGAEGLSLAFRHVISYLIWFCTQYTCEELLHEIIVCVGYFTVNNLDNQVIVQSGRHPTVLQKLCQLPFQYFSDSRLVRLLFPSLIAACYNNLQNRLILEQELSCQLLATFIQDCLQGSSHPVSRTSSHKDFQQYLEFSCRFPRHCWEPSRQFFLKKD